MSAVGGHFGTTTLSGRLALLRHGVTTRSAECSSGAEDAHGFGLSAALIVPMVSGDDGGLIGGGTVPMTVAGPL